MTKTGTNQPLAVNARFDEAGEITPLSFVLHGRTHPISAVGRQWGDNQGRRHFLVMTPPDRIIEIVFHPVDLRWALAGDHERPRLA